MRTHTLLFSFLLLSFFSFGQGPLKFGEINSSAFQADYSSLDTSASMIVTYDYGQTDFVYSPSRGFEMETIIHVRKHLLKKSALSAAIISIPFYRGSAASGEVISRIKANTYNLENGKVVTTELSKKEFFEERVDDDYVQKKLSLNNVKEGSIIEYTYMRTTPLNTFNKPKAWYFQTDVPVVWSEYNITIPSYFFYQIILGGYLPLKVNQRETVNYSIPGTSLGTQAMRYRFGIANAPAFKDESFISSEKDYVSKVDFELSSIEFPGQPVKNFNTTWEELDQTLITSEKWSVGFKTPSFLSDLGKEFKQIENEEERVKKIHAYLVKNFKWDEYVGLWPTETPKKTFDQRKGSATDLNLLAVSLLRSSGIQANPVILSTRSNGKINTIYPLLDRFNYTMAVAHVGDRKILFDITEPLLPPGLIPQRCFGGQGREINEAGGAFIDLKLTAGYSEYEEIEAEISPEDGQLSGTYKIISAGFSEHALRKQFNQLGQKEFEDGLRKAHAEWEISDIKFENIEDVSKQTSLSYKFSKEEGGVMPDMIYLTPLIAGSIKENIFKSDKRLYPIDFGHETNLAVKVSYTIPAGFAVEEMPKSATVNLPEKGGKFMFVCQQADNRITVLSRISLTQAVYPAESFVSLKEFYELIVQKHAEQIVLKRIEE